MECRIMGQKPGFSRVLLKVSGEALMGSKDFGIDMDMAARVAGEVVRAVRDGVQVDAVTYPWEQKIPSFAKRSMCGVRIFVCP